MSDPPEGSRPDLRGVLLEVPAHQWWSDEGGPLRIRVLSVDAAGADDPLHGWVRVEGYRFEPGGAGVRRVRVLVQASALPPPSD